MSSRDEAKRILEEALKRSGAGAMFDEAAATHGAEFREQVIDKIAGRVRDGYSMRAIGDVFASLADEARAIRLRMEPPEKTA